MKRERGGGKEEGGGREGGRGGREQMRGKEWKGEDRGKDKRVEERRGRRGEQLKTRGKH